MLQFRDMALTRVIVTLPYFTNVPEDAATNTFYFATVAEMTLPEASAVALRLDAFYGAIDQYLSSILNPQGVTYKFYHMSDPEPRTPFLTTVGPVLTLGSGGLPEECAICCSYYATPVSGESPARRRGRIYVGPLAQTAYQTGTSTGFSQVAVAARTAIANAATVLADQSETSQWVVYSTVDQIGRQIVAGWVDNSLDTQRRRGRRWNTRSTWTGQP